MIVDITDLSYRLGELVTKKRKRYGRGYAAAGDVLRALYPGGIRPDQYTDVAIVTRIAEKLARIAARVPGEKDDESPYMDLAGMALCGWEKDLDENL